MGSSNGIKITKKNQDCGINGKIPISFMKNQSLIMQEFKKMPFNCNFIIPKE